MNTFRSTFPAALAAAVLAAPGASARPTVSVRAPDVATTGERVSVTGRVSSRVRVAVALEQRVDGRWAVRARSRSGARGAYTLRWRAPQEAAVVTLRVSAKRGRRRVISSRPRQVAVSPTTVVGPATVVDAPPPGQPGTLRLHGRADVGDFVALGVTAETPLGMLGRVTAVRRDGADTLVDTVPASIVDAVPAGHLTLGPAAAKRVRAAAASQPFSHAFGCGVDRALDLDGSVALDLDPRFELDWSWGRIREAEASVALSGSADVTATLTGAAECSLDETALAHWDAPPLRFFAGPIPVVVVPRTELFVSASASAGGAVEAKLHGSLDAAAGLRYEDGDLTPIGRFAPAFDGSASAPAAFASVGARLTPSITFLMYGQAGPRFDVSVGPQLDAGDDGWALTLPVELRAGLAVPHVDSLTIPQRTVFSRSFELARGERSHERARVTWDTGADVDLHVWDAAGRHAWFESNDIPGGTLSRDDVDGFGPEVFSGGPAGLSYGLCLFDDHAAGPTHVTVRLDDGRSASYTLTSKGDSAMVAGGHAPAGDWCKPR